MGGLSDKDVAIFDHIEVNGASAHPLYKFMKAAQPVAVPSEASGGGTPPPSGNPIRWNYEK